MPPNPFPLQPQITTFHSSLELKHKYRYLFWNSAVEIEPVSMPRRDKPEWVRNRNYICSTGCRHAVMNPLFVSARIIFIPLCSAMLLPFFGLRTDVGVLGSTCITYEAMFLWFLLTNIDSVCIDLEQPNSLCNLQRNGYPFILTFPKDMR